MAAEYDDYIKKYAVDLGISSSPSTDINEPLKSIIISGINNDIDTGVQEDILKRGGTHAFLSAAETLNVVSSSAADTSSGTGARLLLLEGLDSEYSQILEVVTLNGTGTVETAQAFLRVNFARIISSGTGQVNAGNIDITGSLSGTNVKYISSGDAFAKELVYTVPAGYELFLTNTDFTLVRSAANSYVTVSSRVFVPSTNTVIKGVEFGVAADSGRTTSTTGNSLPRIPEKTDFWYRVDEVSGNNSRVSGNVRGILAHSSAIPNFTKVTA